MASGNIDFSDIMKASGIESNAVLTDTLAKLIKMEIIRKEFPINKENDRSKSHYFINDNPALFHFTYLHRYASQRQIMDENVFFDRFILPDFKEHYVPKTFEKICLRYLLRKNLKGQIEPPIEKAGKYYYDDPKNKKNGEFDIVTLDQTGYIFYEAEFKSTPMTEGMIRKETQQVSETSLRSCRYGFFSKSGFQDELPPGCITYTPEVLYKAE